MEKVHALAYATGKLAFIYDGGNIAILETTSGKISKLAIQPSFLIIGIAGQSDYVVVGDWLGDAIVMNWRTGETLFSTRETDVTEIETVLFTHNDDTVIISGNSTVAIYNITDDTLYDQFPRLIEQVVATIIEKDNILLCADWTGRIHFFNMVNHKRIRQYKVDEEIYEVAVSEHDEALYTWHGSYAGKWNLKTGEHILSFGNEFKEDFEFTGGTLSQTGDMLISTGNFGSIHLWDTSTGQLIKTLSGHQPNVSGLAVTEDNILYSCGWDGAIRRWNLETFEGAEVDITGFD